MDLNFNENIADNVDNKSKQIDNTHGIKSLISTTTTTPAAPSSIVDYGFDDDDDEGNDNEDGNRMMVNKKPRIDTSNLSTSKFSSTPSDTHPYPLYCNQQSSLSLSQLPRPLLPPPPPSLNFCDTNNNMTYSRFEFESKCKDSGDNLPNHHLYYDQNHPFNQPTFQSTSSYSGSQLSLISADSLSSDSKRYASNKCLQSMISATINNDHDHQPIQQQKAIGTFTITGEKIRRPPNSFMIYAKNRRREILYANPHMTNKDVSKQLGYEWRQLPDDRREYFKQLALNYSVEHKNKYPGYYYSPIEARKRKKEKCSKRMKLMVNNDQYQQPNTSTNHSNESSLNSQAKTLKLMTNQSSTTSQQHQQVPSNQHLHQQSNYQRPSHHYYQQQHLKTLPQMNCMPLLSSTTSSSTLSSINEQKNNGDKQMHSSIIDSNNDNHNNNKTGYYHNQQFPINTNWSIDDNNNKDDNNFNNHNGNGFDRNNNDNHQIQRLPSTSESINGDNSRNVNTMSTDRTSFDHCYGAQHQNYHQGQHQQQQQQQSSSSMKIHTSNNIDNR